MTLAKSIIPGKDRDQTIPYSSPTYAHKGFLSVFHLPTIKAHPHSTEPKTVLYSECSPEDFPISDTFGLQNILYPYNLHKPPLICSLKFCQTVQGQAFCNQYTGKFPCKKEISISKATGCKVYFD